MIKLISVFFFSSFLGIVLEPIEIEVFTEAKKRGIHRTVHAGEAAPAESVRQVRLNNS